MGYVVAKQEAAVSSDSIDLTGGQFPKTISVAGLLTSEEIEIFVIDADDATADPLPLYDSDGDAVLLVATSQPLIVSGPIWLQFEKPSTTNAVGIKITNISI